MRTASSYNKQINSLSEIKEIITHIYDHIEPGVDDDCGWCGDILLHKKALCYGYVWITATILKTYGYDVHWLTLYARNMPRGRGSGLIDTHEIIELTQDKQNYLLCPTSKRILMGSIKSLIKDPGKADSKFWGNNPPDKRFVQRHYSNYITSFIFDRLIYYKRTGIPLISQPGGRSRLIRKYYNLIHFRLPSLIRHKR